ncbi:MAG: enoyl-CoA hydratase/isomerase family protein [Halobacteriaceae archaeon]
MADSEFVTVERVEDGDVAVVTIDRPEKLNALRTEVNDGLAAAFERVEDAVAVVLRSAGAKAFVAGADLEEVRGLSDAEFGAFQRNARATNDAVADHPAAVVAAVEGLAYGGGFELALAADLVVAGEGARFALPEVGLGLIPGGGATQRLPRLVGANRAKELLVTGDPIDAETAREWGVVNRVVPDGEVDEAARDLATDVAGNAPLAVREAARVVDEGLESSLATGLSLEQEVTFTLRDTADAAEGLAAFAEDREPEFEGR